MECGSVLIVISEKTSHVDLLDLLLLLLSLGSSLCGS